MQHHTQLQFSGQAPPSTSQRVSEEWKPSNVDLFFILDYPFEGAARSCARRSEFSKDGRSDGKAAWKGLSGEFEHARGYRLHFLSRQLVAMKLAAGSDPDDLLAEVKRPTMELKLGETVSEKSLESHRGYTSRFLPSKCLKLSDVKTIKSTRRLRHCKPLLVVRSVCHTVLSQEAMSLCL